jgi:hypothetical protein
MASLLTVAMTVLATTQLEARRVQQQIFGMEALANGTRNAWDHVRGHADRGAETLRENAEAGWQTVSERTSEAVEAAQGHAATAREQAARGIETARGHAETAAASAAEVAGNVAETTQAAASTAAARTQEAAAQAQEAATKAHKKTKEAIADLTCDDDQLDFAKKTLTDLCAEQKEYDCVAGVFSTKGKNKKKTQSQWVQCFDNPPLLTYGAPTCEKSVADDKTTYVLACNLCIAHTSVCLHWFWWALGLVALFLCCCCFCVGICCASS